MKTKINNDTVGLKELRENMETYIKRVSNGESITVFRRSSPLFKLTPIGEDEAEWESVIDFTKETGRGVPIDQLLASMKKMHGQKSKVS
jgi:prevent-host-death family protein